MGKAHRAGDGPKGQESRKEIGERRDGKEDYNIYFPLSTPLGDTGRILMAGLYKRIPDVFGVRRIPATAFIVAAEVALYFAFSCALRPAQGPSLSRATRLTTLADISKPHISSSTFRTLRVETPWKNISAQAGRRDFVCLFIL